jgi:NADH-quinone oxidoreductase subunit F
MTSFDARRRAAGDKWDALRKGDITTIYVGTASCGRAAGALAVLEAAQTTIREHHLNARIIEVGCIGPCYLEPLMDIEMPGRPRVSYPNVGPAQARELIESCFLKGDPCLHLAAGHFGEGQGALTNGLPRFFDLPMLKPQVRVVLRNCGFIDPEDIDHYIANDGYAGLMKAFEMGPDRVIEEIERAGLRGRGGAGFPTFLKWRLCRGVPSDTKYMICNADEGDPGAFMNRSLIEGDPHAVLEGMLIAAYAIGAPRGVVYIRAEYPLAITRLRKAIAQMRDYGLLGENIQASGFDFEITIKEGAGAFVCGEETALIASIEGRRGMPKPRPPYPVASGLHGKPTVINNVETLGTLPNILRNGADWYRQFGTEKNRGTKTFSLVGKVERAGLIEVPLGTPLRNIIFDVGGGTKKRFKAVQTGGPSGGCLSVADLDTPVEYESLAAKGSIMGSGGLIVLDEDTCAVDLARYFISFCAEESCGKCAPCRVGTDQMLRILERICRGHGRDGDIEMLERIGGVVKSASLCGLGQTASNPVLATIRQFRKEYEDHVYHKRCAAGVCQDLFLSPCQNACPVGMDVPGYISMIAAGRFDEAVRIGRETNPFLSVCGRVCDHPCMLKCRRNQLDGPVEIRALKRFIGDYAREHKIKKDGVWMSADRHDEKVAIIGGGPSGLSCAYFLSRLGYLVTVFERLPVAGGMLAVGIPTYRLPKDVLEAEIEVIRDMGVEIRTRTTVGRDVKVADLVRQGFKAIYAAVGMYGDRALGVPGEDAKGVVQGVDFLTDVSLGKRVSVGRQIAVIGGGNTAVDAARTVLRLGSEKVTVVYRRTRDEMPAFEEEIKEAEDEGVEIVYLATPVEVVKDGEGQVAAIRCVRMRLGEFDNQGRRKPVPLEGSEFTMDVDMVIPAVGEFADVRDLFADINVGTNKDGTVTIDESGSTNIPGIFAGGDVAVGASTVIKAVASGERAAVAIDRYLRKDRNRQYPWRVRSRSPVEFDPNAAPVDHPAFNPKICGVEERRRSFVEVQESMTAEAAEREATRCLRCDYGGNER